MCVPCDYPEDLTGFEDEQPLHHVRVIDDTDELRAGLYRLAIGIFQVAQAEANGQLSHWSGVSLSEEQKGQLRANATYFIEDWQGFFRRRTSFEKDSLCITN